MILLIEDNNELRAYIAEYLENENFKVITSDGNNIEDIDLSEVKLAIIDIMLGGLNGFDLYKDYILIHNIKTLFLTCLTSDNVIKQALNNENEYLSKPFKNVELLYRIKKLLKIKEKIIYKDLTLYPEENAIYKGDVNLNFSTLEYVIFNKLRERKGTVLREELINLIEKIKKLFLIMP